MKITILTMGSRGDVQPYIALAQGLQQAGHEVTLCTAATFRALAESHHLKFAPVSADIIQMMQNEQGLQAMESRNPIGFLNKMMEQMLPAVKRMSQEVFVATEGVDLIIVSSTMLFLAQALHEWRGTPFLPAYPQPLLPTRDFQAMGMPALPAWMPQPLRGAYNRFTHYVAIQVFYSIFRRAGNAMRQEQMGLPPMPRFADLSSLYDGSQPLIYSFSEHVVPISDLPATMHICGYWFTETTDWTPPDDLLQFLDSGDKPIYVGFGSMTDRQPQELTHMIMDALKITGKRAVLLSGWGNLGSTQLPDSIHVLHGAPHDWLFPRVAAAIHHGGAGTTGASLRAGIPTVVVPFIADQPFWGERVEALGVGPAPIPRKKLTTAGLVTAIRATDDPQMQQKAAALGQQIRAEDGVATAIKWIEHYYGKK
ncbi:MAG: glycosyltransferase family 1 protein [Anaerolineae bacterium]|nr:glycosyltransferase family 1 protein [Anaerolineae bacterium]